MGTDAQRAILNKEWQVSISHGVDNDKIGRSEGVVREKYEPKVKSN